MAFVSNILEFEAQKVIAFGAIGVGYTGIGTATTKPGISYIIQNLTDADLQFSWNGVDDHFPLAAGSQYVQDIGANGPKNIDLIALPVGSRLYVKQIGAPTTGSVYFSIVHIKHL